jgi:hypothetical protein
MLVYRYGVLTLHIDLSQGGLGLSENALVLLLKLLSEGKAYKQKVFEIDEVNETFDTASQVRIVGCNVTAYKSIKIPSVIRGHINLACSQAFYQTLWLGWLQALKFFGAIRGAKHQSKLFIQAWTLNQTCEFWVRDLGMADCTILFTNCVDGKTLFSLVTDPSSRHFLSLLQLSKCQVCQHYHVPSTV